MAATKPRKWRQGAHRYHLGNYTWEVWKQPDYYPFGLFLELSLFRPGQSVWITLGRWTFFVHIRYDIDKGGR